MTAKLRSKDARATKRARSAELRRAAKLEAAKRQEDKDEAITPAAQRQPVLTPDGDVLRSARVMRDGVTFIRANPLAQIISGIERGNSMFNATHIAAAKRLLNTWDAVGGGIGLGASDWGSLRGARGTAPTTPSGHSALVAQVEQEMELHHVSTCLGALWPCLHSIVLEGMSVAAWAGKKRINANAAGGFLLAALSNLVLIYRDRDVPLERRGRVRTVVVGERVTEPNMYKGN